MYKFILQFDNFQSHYWNHLKISSWNSVSFKATFVWAIHPKTFLFHE